MSAIVLGVGPGLGLALAHAYAGAGHKVALVARRPEQVRELSAQVGNEGLGLVADLADPHAVARVVQEAAERLGAPDIVHYNASLLIEGTPTQIPLHAVEQSWRVGCLGAWAALQAAAPLMSRGAAFFATGSGVALDPWPPGSALASAKAGLRNMMLAAAKDLPNIRVAMITIMGVIGQTPELSPDQIARGFLDLLEQSAPPVETFLPHR